MENLSISEVHGQLVSVSRNNASIIDDLRRSLDSWNYRSIVRLEDVRDNIPQVIEEIIDYFFPNGDFERHRLEKCLWTFVHHEIYDAIFARLKAKYVREDLTFYKKSRAFGKAGGTPKELGATFYNFIPNAAVVELSVLASKRTPHEKLICLQSTYDYIFAEIKGALISVISKYSEKEIDIPTVSNQEVLPILMAVVLKSKLFYFVSEMAYIREFGRQELSDRTDLREAFEVFETAYDRISASKHQSRNRHEKMQENLNVCETINFIESIVNDKTTSSTVLIEEKRRIANLIVSATTEDLEDFV